MHAPSNLPFRQLFVVAVLLVASIAAPAPVAGHGSFSTSDYRISWPDRWHSVRETGTNLILSDGITYIHAVGVFETAPPESSVTDLVDDWFTNVIAGENIAEIEPATTLSPDRAFAIYTYRYRVSEQRLDPYAVYFEARRLSSELMLWLVVDTHLGLYRAAPHVFVDAVSGLQLDGAEPAGEPAQSFASGPWSIAIPAAVVDDAMASLGLRRVPDSRWLVVLADIANTDSDANDFDIDSAVIESEGGTSIPPSPIDSQIVSETLRLEDVLSDAGSVQPGTQIRVALVYLVPDDATGLRFSVGEQSLQIEERLVPEIGVGSLPPRPQIKPLISGEIRGWTDEGTVQIRTTDGDNRELVLLGADIPASQSCYGEETHRYLQTLVGEDVAIEFDPASLSTNHAYLWLDPGTSAPILLNHHLLEMGMASIVALPEHARFEMWLEQTESSAQSEGRGRWTDCA